MVFCEPRGRTLSDIIAPLLYRGCKGLQWRLCAIWRIVHQQHMHLPHLPEVPATSGAADQLHTRQLHHDTFAFKKLLQPRHRMNHVADAEMQGSSLTAQVMLLHHKPGPQEGSLLHVEQPGACRQEHLHCWLQGQLPDVGSTVSPADAGTA